MKRTRLWSERDSARLIALRDALKLTWHMVAINLGRTPKQCQMRYYYVHRHVTSARRAERAAEFKQRPPIQISTAAIQQALPEAPRSARVMTTAQLLLDAELRSRIGAQGITAGLCGDPGPGRSALDKRDAGAA